ncbi:hypothetical protein Ae168Ps1_4066 [Pseudonocardia sp. Ae168_Ps1]|nr:hypothetical protein Ae150APs1_4039 [Pseudonocardia sp. Ae150A_Ps1]OLL81660.1 hypothetical protein Ae168Ps1_4066 [Pseudonocardia sp. Ae168_Ps1]OLL84227.1 hypothetical protein Ae263Ps1_1282c [Pseudonocardia sp. Ae263_Ps1]OLL95755.1 hypothetical protein Ae356Ps1_5652 [Pseudonocardia sp. Ae356_Ps1]
MSRSPRRGTRTDARSGGILGVTHTLRHHRAGPGCRPDRGRGTHGRTAQPQS